MKSLVVLGGADGAITTVRAARRLGLHTICVDQRADAPALRHADEHLDISTRDLGRLTEVLSRRDDVVGVLSPASDVNLPSQYHLARQLDLPTGLSEAALRASVDKGFFRAVCDRLGQPGPQYVQGPPDQVLAAMTELTFPVMVKPTDSSGGRGVTQCATPAELPAALATATEWSTSRIVIAEEYLVGDHYAAEAIVRDGRIALFGLGRRELTPPPHFVTIAHTMPGASEELSQQVRAMLDDVCRELDYRWGSLNVDILVTPDGRVVLVELGARLGGNGSAELLGLVHGLDVTEASVAMAIGELPPLESTRQWSASFQVLSAPQPGKLVTIHNLATVRSAPNVVDLVISASPGDQVEPYHRAGAKVGYALVAAPDSQQLQTALDQLAKLLQVEVLPNSDLTETHE